MTEPSITPYTEAAQDEKPFMWLSGGRKIHFPFPLPGEICIEDIAHGLSNICRFGGHTKHFYSVAEHSLRVSFAISVQPVASLAARHEQRIHAMQGLLHDAPEAYYGDMIRPLKYGTAMGAHYRLLEGAMHRAIFTTFELPVELPEIVRAFDDAFCQIELRELVFGLPGATQRGEFPPAEIKCGFLRRFHALKNAIGLGPDLSPPLPEEK